MESSDPQLTEKEYWRGFVAGMWDHLAGPLQKEPPVKQSQAGKDSAPNRATGAPSVVGGIRGQPVGKEGFRVDQGGVS